MHDLGEVSSVRLGKKRVQSWHLLTNIRTVFLNHFYQTNIYFLRRIHT